MYRASRVERSLRSVPPRVSNFFLSVSRSTVPANAKADLSRRAFLRVEEAMRNWPRPMKIRTIRLYVTRERCIFHLVSLSPSSPSPSFSSSVRMKWTLTRETGLRNCDICQDVSSSASQRSIFISPRISPLLAFFCVSPDRKRKWRNRGGFSRAEKPRRLVARRVQ